MIEIKQIDGLQAKLDEAVTIDPGYIEFVIDGDIAVFDGDESKQIMPTGVKISDLPSLSLGGYAGEIVRIKTDNTNQMEPSGVVIGPGAASGSRLWPSIVFGDAALKNTGSTSGTVCAGDDSRLGGTPANPADNSVTYVKFHSSLKSRSAVSASDIDWSSAVIFTKTLTAATTLTFSNLQLNKVITLLLTGNYTLTLPTSCNRISGTYDGSVSNYISMHCVNDADGSEEVWFTISQEAT